MDHHYRRLPRKKKRFIPASLSLAAVVITIMPKKAHLEFMIHDFEGNPSSKMV
jgi:hypothetical protein